MSVFPHTIYDYIVQEKNAYETKEIEVSDNWSWNMRNHIILSFLMKYGKYRDISNDPKTKPPFHNIIMPILEWRYAAEDRDVKDIIFETEEPDKQHLSFLIKKYWDDVFTIENNLDEFLDDAIESKVDYGGVLIKKGMDAVPEVIPLQSIAFCDQTNILGAPIGFKFMFSPAQLKLQARAGWGTTNADTTIDNLILLAQKNPNKGSKGIEVYVVRGELPKAYFEGNDMDTLLNQVHVVAFYQDEKGKIGKTLYKSKETENVLKFNAPKKVYNRALGWGGIEALIDPQIWANFAEIHKNNLLKAASKVGLFTDDENFVNRNKVREMENLETLTIDKESRYGIRQIPTTSPNIALFDRRVQELEAHAQNIAGVTDSLLGKQPPAGTPFRLQERVVFEGKKPHERIAGKFDKFLEEIIQDWIVPHIVRKITKGAEFLSTLTADEMEYVMRQVPKNRAIKRQWEDILSGREVGDLAKYEEEEKQKLSGNRFILKILKDEFKEVKLKVKIRISGKQKDMALFVDKLTNILKQYWTLPPELKSDPTTQHLMAQIFEASGLSPTDINFEAPLPAISEQATKPIRELAEQKTL